jgi:putative Mg2+ transporter-C (MgtC) family protein
MRGVTAKAFWRPAAPIVVGLALCLAPRPGALDAAAWRDLALFAAVRTDVSDLPDAGQAAGLVVRRPMAALPGGALGDWRRRAGKAASVRTHRLVAPGAAPFVLIPQQAGAAPGDVTRVLQGIVAGVGFLGAGTTL